MERKDKIMQNKEEYNNVVLPLEVKKFNEKLDDQEKKISLNKVKLNQKLKSFNKMMGKSQIFFNKQKMHFLENFKKNEEDRIKHQTILDDHIKKKISKKNQEFLDTVKHKYEDKMSLSTAKFLVSQEQKINEQIKEHEKITELPILKYEQWYITHYQEMKKQKQEKKSHKEKVLQKIQDNAEALEIKRKKKGLELVKKMDKRELIKKRNQRRIKQGNIWQGKRRA